MPVFGAVEAGGTKFVAGLGTGPDDLREIVIPTTTPDDTLWRVVEFLRTESGGTLAALGIGTFGPADIDPASPTWGHITSTPKPGWQNCDIAGILRDELGVQVAFDTDVNAALLGEHRWGAAQGVSDALYLTVGTGIGGGAMAGGGLIHGLLHPEMGHIRVPQDSDDDFPGVCPFHGNCLEGLASGPAMEARWGVAAAELPEEHPGWEIEARYIAHALVNYICVLSPRVLVVGGGVGQRPHLLAMARKEVQRILNGYLRSPRIESGIDDYIVAPALGSRSGVLGALALAMDLKSA